MIFYAMEVKRRRSSAAAAAAKDVYNPFAYREAAAAAAAAEDDEMDDSQSSREQDNDSSSSSSRRRRQSTTTRRNPTIYVTILTLLLVGFAAGLLYHLVVQPALFTTRAADVDEFVTDEVVKKLAQQNQYQQEQIANLKKQMEARERLQQQEAAEAEAAERERERQQREAEEEAAAQRRADAAIKTKRTVYTPKPRRVIDMSQPQNAEGHVVGRIDEETGIFIKTTTTNLRGQQQREGKEEEI